MTDVAHVDPLTGSRSGITSGYFLEMARKPANSSATTAAASFAGTSSTRIDAPARSTTMHALRPVSTDFLAAIFAARVADGRRWRFRFRWLVNPLKLFASLWRGIVRQPRE